MWVEDHLVSFFSSIKLYRDSYHLILKLSIMSLVKERITLNENKIDPIPPRNKVCENSFFPCCIKKGSSHLNQRKFWHNFKDTVDSTCTCGFEPETTLHYLLHCNLYSTQRLELLNNICTLNLSLQKCSNEKLLNILLYGSEDFHCNMNKKYWKLQLNF